LINAGMSPWFGMFIGAICATGVGVLVGWPCFRLRGPYFALTTIAFAEILRIWTENTEEIFGVELRGAQGLSVPLKGHAPALFQFDGKVPYYYIIIAMLVAVMVVTWWMERSRMGFYLKAIRADQDGAEALGVNSTRYLLSAMAVSSFPDRPREATALEYFRYINPSGTWASTFPSKALMGIVGGRDRLGPVLGAFLLTLRRNHAGHAGGKFPGLHLVIYGLVLILAMLFLPKGLIQPIRRLLGRKSAASRESEPAAA
jgi:branched-chain amino acid transport system permease protein